MVFSFSAHSHPSSIRGSVSPDISLRDKSSFPTFVAFEAKLSLPKNFWQPLKMAVISKLLSSTMALSLLIAPTLGTPVNYMPKTGVESRQTGSFYGITGIKLGGVQPRLEIRQLQQNPEMWNLYLLALEQFKGMDQSERLSYYQISGKDQATYNESPSQTY